MVWRRVQAGMQGERARGRAYQPRFHGREVLASWLGAVALLGVLLAARPGSVLMPVLSGSLLLTAMAVLLSRLQPSAAPYPEHWL